MRRLGGRVLDYLTSEPLRIRAFLRLPLIALIALIVYFTHSSHEMDGAFTALIAAYAVVAAVSLAVALRTAVIPPWYGWASTAVDVVIVLVLCVASGPGVITTGSSVALYPILFLLPISVAIMNNPVVTGMLGLSVTFGYLLVWVVYATRDENMGTLIPGVVYVRAGCLLWLTAATTALSFTLARRAARVRALLDVRRTLVSESMRADERRNRELSEQLHDGPLQTLLAARLDLDELRDNPSDEGFDRLDSALRDSVAALRSTVGTLHPQVLAQVGLTAAMRDLVHGYEQRWGTPVDAAIDEVGQAGESALVYRAARELLANAHKHSQASRLEVALRRVVDGTELRVADDGVGFDPEILSRRVAEGHIGLASLVVTVEATGGSVDVDARPGAGTTITVTVPDAAPDPT